MYLTSADSTAHLVGVVIYIWSCPTFAHILKYYCSVQDTETGERQHRQLVPAGRGQGPSPPVAKA